MKLLHRHKFKFVWSEQLLNHNYSTVAFNVMECSCGEQKTEWVW